MINNKYTKIAITVAMGLGLSTSAFAADTGTQQVTMTVPVISEISFANAPTILIIAPAAGAQPAATNSTGATWAMSSNSAAGETQILSAQIPVLGSLATETGATLSINVTAPGTDGDAGTSLGAVDITDGTSHDVVSAITTNASSGLDITYVLDTPLTVTDGDLSREVTFTLAAATL